MIQAPVGRTHLHKGSGRTGEMAKDGTQGRGIAVGAMARASRNERVLPTVQGVRDEDGIGGNRVCRGLCSAAFKLRKVCEAGRSPR